LKRAKEKRRGGGTLKCDDEEQLKASLLCLFHCHEHRWIQRDGGDVSKIPVEYKNGKYEARKQTLVADNRFSTHLLV
jgi:hypothetical protein